MESRIAGIWDDADLLFRDIEEAHDVALGGMGNRDNATGQSGGIPIEFQLRLRGLSRRHGTKGHVVDCKDGWTGGAKRNGRIRDEEYVGTPEQKRRGDLLPDQFGKEGFGTKARRAADVEKLADAMLRGNFPQGAQEVDDVEADARILSGGFPNVKGNLHVGDLLRRREEVWNVYGVASYSSSLGYVDGRSDEVVGAAKHGEEES